MGQSGVRMALQEAGVGLIAVIDGCGPTWLLATRAKSDELYVQWPGFDVRSADYLQHIALALACQDPKELMKVTSAEHIPRMICEAAWLVDSAGDCDLLLEMKAGPNDAADAFVRDASRAPSN